MYRVKLFSHYNTKYLLHEKNGFVESSNILAGYRSEE